MRKIYLFFIFICFFFCSNAQITKGNWMVGGSATFSQQQQESTAGQIKSTRIFVTPNIGYFFIDKFAAGLKPSLSFYKDVINENKVTNTLVGIGPFFRYYFLHKENIVNIFAETDYQYSSGSNEYRQNLYLFSAGPVIYFNSNVGLEFSLNYEIIKRVGAISSTKTFFFGVGFQIHLEKEQQ